MSTQQKYMEGEEFVKKILAGEKDFSKVRLEEGFDLTVRSNLHEQLQDYLHRSYEGYLDVLYDQKENFKAEPIVINESSFIRFKANRLCFPFAKGNKADFCEAELYGVVFSGAELEDSYFKKAKLNNSRFSYANLKRARFEEANLQDATFYNANLLSAYLWDANLEKTDFVDAQLPYTRLNSVNALNADFRGSNLEGADLDRARFCGANLENANLTCAKLNGTEFDSANLKGVKGLKRAEYLMLAHFYETKVTLKERAIIKKALSKKKHFFIEDYD